MTIFNRLWSAARLVWSVVRRVATGPEWSPPKEVQVWSSTGEMVFVYDCVNDKIVYVRPSKDCEL